MRQSYLNQLHALARSLPREHRVAVWNPALRRYVIPNTKPETIVAPGDLEATGVDWVQLGDETAGGDWM